MRNRRDPTWQPCRAKTGRIKPDGGSRAEPGGGPRGPYYQCRRVAKRVGGKGLCFGHVGGGGKREDMPETANNPSEKARQLCCPAIGVCQVRLSGMGSGEGMDRRSDDPSKGPILSVRWRHARRIKKIIVKPCAGKPHARFERGLMETGWR